MNELFYKKILFGGHEYWCPKQIGAGIRSKFQKMLMQSVMGLSNLEQLTPVIQALEAGNDYAFEQGYKKLLGNNPNSLNELVDFARMQTLAILNTLLIPCDGSPSVEDTYDLAASEEEVNKLINFFGANAQSKTKNVSGKINTGKGSAKRRGSR